MTSEASLGLIPRSSAAGSFIENLNAGGNHGEGDVYH